jgi:hypothetical protein
LFLVPQKMFFHFPLLYISPLQQIIQGFNASTQGDIGGKLIVIGRMCLDVPRPYRRAKGSEYSNTYIQ